ncbi:MAG: enoyl-CoA hydratase [Actinomycetia bacterium]|nr:enoyl-CoA hydratase [Actinomycetes bacterium]MCP4227842.1 enoyl-CoA hydratase [Actinomycetes bacterium]MCP5033239.1 enoyl-CoA hydratase [Actinomycetes bacterium]
MNYEQIEVEDRGPIRVITLSRPEKLNAWTRRMSREMVDAIDDGNQSDAIGAFVFTGAGRAFCAGADIGAEFASRDSGDSGGGGSSEGGSQPSGEQGERARDWVELVRSSKPMVAALNGPAVGVGLTLTLSMDYLVAAQSARLSARFVKMGLVPELASSHFLVQRCGWGGASDLALSGRLVPASEALAMGLVDKVATDDELVDVAMGHAESYAENPPTALRMIKQLLTANGSQTDLTAVQAAELKSLNEAFRSPDHGEAVAAFLEKRQPKFR